MKTLYPLFVNALQITGRKWLPKKWTHSYQCMLIFTPQLQKNGLLTLCCDRILHEVTFDKYWCARLVLDCLLSFHDPSTDRMAVAICSILAAKISTAQTTLLGAKVWWLNIDRGLCYFYMTIKTTSFLPDRNISFPGVWVLLLSLFLLTEWLHEEIANLSPDANGGEACGYYTQIHPLSSLEPHR